MVRRRGREAVKIADFMCRLGVKSGVGKLKREFAASVCAGEEGHNFLTWGALFSNNQTIGVIVYLCARCLRLEDRNGNGISHRGEVYLYQDCAEQLREHGWVMVKRVRKGGKRMDEDCVVG